MRKKLACAIIIVCTVMVASVMFYLSPFPRQDSIQAEYPDQFVITKPNLHETQGNNQCSAFAIAYVLRHYDIRVQGNQVYEQIPYKIPWEPWRGYVPYKGVLKVVNKYNLKPTLFTGNIATLKTQLSRGVPVIVIVGNGLKWQHYMTLVGYDDNINEMYFYDSGRQGDTNGNQPGNRTITGDYFLTLWDNGLPLLNNVYIVVEE